MPIGMSNAMSGGFWNPRAKYPNGIPLQVNGAPEIPTSGSLPQGDGMPGGQLPQFPPIAPSRNLLNRHMELPQNQNGPVVFGVPGQTRGTQNTPRAMGAGIIRRMPGFGGVQRRIF